MKILLIDNGEMVERNGNFFTNKMNGILLNELINKGFEVHYFQFSKINTHSINFYNLNANGVFCEPQKYYKSKIASYIVAYIKLIRNIVNYDFIHIYYPNKFKFIIIFCILLNKRYGLYIRGMKGVRTTYSKWCYKHSKIVVTVSNLFTKDIKCISLKEKPLISYNVDDINWSRNYHTKSNFRLLYLGRIDKDKGLKELLYAVKELRTNNNKIQLNIVGSGQDSDEIREIIKTLNIGDIVSMYGAEYDPIRIADCYKHSDVYILPSYHEGFPRTLYEAMIFGTPIITTMVGGIPEVMTNKYNCIGITPHNIESIVEAVEFAINNYMLMSTFASKNFYLISDILSLPSHSQILSDVLMS